MSDGKYDNPMNTDLQRARKNIEAIRERRNLTIPRHDKDEHKLERQRFEDGTRHVSSRGPRNARGFGHGEQGASGVGSGSGHAGGRRLLQIPLW